MRLQEHRAPTATSANDGLLLVALVLLFAGLVLIGASAAAGAPPVGWLGIPLVVTGGVFLRRCTM